MTPGTRVQHPKDGREGTVQSPHRLFKGPTDKIVVLWDNWSDVGIYKPADLIEVKESKE